MPNTKRSFRLLRWTVIATALLLATPPGWTQSILKQEPALGELREGQSVMVDDGTCPKGQVKLVTGGNHKKAGGTKDITRTHACIARPSAM